MVLLDFIMNGRCRYRMFELFGKEHKSLPFGPIRFFKFPFIQDLHALILRLL